MTKFSFIRKIFHSNFRSKKTAILCFIGTVNPVPFSLSSSADNYLTSDSTSQRAIQSGNDVTLISRGAVELILTELTLIVDVNIKSCIGK
uniref:Uncharacterized protein n=1 Tax=Panagrolaimus superbus TaxID=310955 RepID=A0A914Y5P5_9BILA